MKKVIFAAGIIIIGIIVIFIFLDKKDLPEQKGNFSVQDEIVNEEKIRKEIKEDKKGEKIKKFTMKAKRFTYEPNQIEVNQGDWVIIKIKSVDVPHSFTLAEFGDQKKGGINEFLGGILGKEKTIEFIADKKGEFVFGCDVACGKDHDKMLGKLIVK